MRRLAALPCLLLAASHAAAQGTNTSPDVDLRVTLHDGTVLEGRVRFKKDQLEVKAGRTRKVACRDVSNLSVIEPPTREALLKELETRRGRLKEDQDAPAWVRLGRWAREHGLDAEAHAAFVVAHGLDPELAEARAAATGQVKNDDGVWVEGAGFFQRRRTEVAQGDHDGLVELARLALKWDRPDLASTYLSEVLVADIWHKEALKLAAPLTSAYTQRTVPLQLPVRGRWSASPDSSRHHQKKSYAVYALDLTKVDLEGRHCRGDGKTLEDHYAYGAPFYAMAAGKVIKVREGNPDNPIGKQEGMAEKHNGVSIDHGNGELTWYVHAKQGSIQVKVGDEVQAGQLLGEVGNSGGSGIPHLHVTLIAHVGISVPWTCDGYRLIAPDGTPIPVTRAWPREGWIIEGEAEE